MKAACGERESVGAAGDPHAAPLAFAEKDKHGKHDKRAPAADDGAGVDFDELNEKLGAAIDRLRRELAGLRTGRASPAMLDTVTVKLDAGGGHAPLKGVASVAARDAATLIVTPFDSSAAAAVAAGVRASPLGLDPRVEGGEIIVPVPKCE